MEIDTINHFHTVEPVLKGQESPTKVAKVGPFSRTILYKSCLFYPSWQSTSLERPPSWVAFIEVFHCILNAVFKSSHKWLDRADLTNANKTLQYNSNIMNTIHA